MDLTATVLWLVRVAKHYEVCASFILMGHGSTSYLELIKFVFHTHIYYLLHSCICLQPPSNLLDANARGEDITSWRSAPSVNRATLWCLPSFVGVLHADASSTVPAGSGYQIAPLHRSGWLTPYVWCSTCLGIKTVGRAENWGQLKKLICIKFASPEELLINH